MDAVKAALADGTVDAIATDHAPHAPEAKDLPFDQAPPGMLGLQTALALAVDRARPAASRRILALLSWQPAAIAGLDPAPRRRPGRTGGTPGRPPTCASIDPTATWTVDPTALASRSRNTPYAGRTLTGRVRHTVLAGEPVVVDAEAQR